MSPIDGENLRKIYSSEVIFAIEFCPSHRNRLG